MTSNFKLLPIFHLFPPLSSPSCPTLSSPLREWVRGRTQILMELDRRTDRRMELDLILGLQQTKRGGHTCTKTERHLIILLNNKCIQFNANCLYTYIYACIQ